MNTGQNTDKFKNMIFINPKKLNTVQPIKQVKITEDLKKREVCDSIKSLHQGAARVFINPNFKKTTSLPSSQAKLNLSTTSKITQAELKLSTASKGNLLQKEATSKQSHSYCKSNVPIPRVAYNQSHKAYGRELKWSAGVSKQSALKSSIASNPTIFFNPEFSLSKSSKQTTSPFVYKKSEEVKVGSKTLNCVTNKVSSVPSSCASTSSASVNSVSSEGSKISLCKKRQIYFNHYKAGEGPPVSQKRRTSSDSNVVSNNRIFFNPNFERKSQDRNADPPKKDLSVTVNSVEKSPILDISKEIKSLSSGDQLNKSLTSISFPVGCLKGPDHQKVYTKKIVGRIRKRSTSLVSVSPTKLVSKRKSSQNSLEINSKFTLNRPVFLSSTKLVRCSPSSKGAHSDALVKYKAKRAVPKTQLQLLMLDKINKLKKQSFINSISNSATIIPKSPVVTKIRSKNGKSLKLIRKNVDSEKSALESRSITSVSAIQKRKQLLRQQARRNAVLIVQNKWKKSQFSKINVPLKKKLNQSFSHNKYVYKRNDIAARKTKTLVFDKRARFAISKDKCSVGASEKTKVLKSKYSLIRKQPSASVNKCGRTYRDKKTNYPYRVLPSTSKRNWRLKNNVIKKSFKRKELSIVNIGGVFYRCSRTSLSKNKPTTRIVSQKSPLLNIGGQKFKFDDNGQTLTCLDKKPGRKRIDIGGVTFISSPSGTSLTRTNYHTARSILVQAKQKSISLLTRKLKKNNEPCPFYHRLGHCSGKERGTCTRQHDPKYVAVCKRFVQGSCADSQCLLSHTISCHNMPTCQHFLAGQCGRDNCPYPHIKVSESSPICLDFLKGFCPLGDQCAKRHFEICPSFEKGTCSRGKYCPYPHPKSKSNQKLKGKFKYLKKKVQPPPRDVEPVSSSNIRYFEDVNLQKEYHTHLNEDQEKSEEDCPENEEERSHPLKRRPRLGRLPSFIPLSLDESSIYNDSQTP